MRFTLALSTCLPTERRHHFGLLRASLALTEPPLPLALVVTPRVEAAVMDRWVVLADREVRGQEQEDDRGEHESAREKKPTEIIFCALRGKIFLWAD